MRRAFALAPICAALAAAVPASAGLVPINRSFGERTVPRVQAGTIRIPAGHANGTVRVIVRLTLPPLAAALGRTTASSSQVRRLDVRSRSSRAYLARERTAQARTIAALRRAVPDAKVGRRFGILLDGITVTLRPRELPALTRLPSVTRLYGTAAYTLTTNRSPGVIGADVLQRVRGADGTGVKIGVVDDGVDQKNRFFNPAGFTYPAGFPKGGTKWTTPKVIVAKVFPGPNAGEPGRLAVDPGSSFHGTHVAGIAAGDAGTTAPAGPDHPTTSGLSGVAPRAWIGNYRVFTVPTPVGHVANTPEIVAAFEAAVTDGMNVINFSGGGPQTDPANDPMIETIRNVVAAGVVPVIAAGNDRDDFGLGSVGSPGTAPDALTVAAVSNTHVFAQALRVTAAGAPAELQGIPYRGAAGSDPPPGWTTQDQTLVDVGTITGTDGKPVDRHLCGVGSDLASTQSTLPARSLDGAIALAQRGLCPFVIKALIARNAGAVGLILSDNRAGEANEIPLRLSLPAAMIANQDGDRLRVFMAGTKGRTTIRVGANIEELVTGRSGIVTSFSSAGLSPFGHFLKPDVSAPGGSILSSTLPQFMPSAFAVFDGTSMATPHVAGSAALLVQLHPDWTPQQIKSALVSTAQPAWGDTARTQEAPVPLEGGGLVWLPSAADPRIFTTPSSLSFQYIDVTHGAQERSQLVRLRDAGGGAGTWTVSLAPQVATSGATIDFPGVITIAPGGEADLPVDVHAPVDAQPGDDYGFIVLTQGGITRRIPYDFKVERPALEQVDAKRLEKFVQGDTTQGPDRVRQYAYPAAPFGNPPDQAPMNEDGSEKLYVLHINRPVVNAGVSVVVQSEGTRVDPWFLGSKDENDVQGQAGTPINVNDLMFDFLLPVSAAATVMPRQQAFYVSVDSGHEQFTNRRLAGRYLLRSWVNDVTAPSFHVITTRVSAGRPLIVARTFDQGSGVDPFSLVVGYKRVLVGAAAYDPLSGIAVFPLPGAAPKLTAGKTKAIFESSDYEEAKNVETISNNILPNTTFRRAVIRVVTGPAVSWVNPPPEVCVARTTRLLVAASASAGVRAVRFTERGKRVGGKVSGAGGLWAADWNTARVKQGRHVVTATVRDRRGRTFAANRVFRVCR